MLRDAFAINDETQIQAMVDQTIPVLESALNDFKLFLDANFENATFRLWNDYLEFVSHCCASSGVNVWQLASPFGNVQGNAPANGSVRSRQLHKVGNCVSLRYATA